MAFKIGTAFTELTVGAKALYNGLEAAEKRFQKYGSTVRKIGLYGKLAFAGLTGAIGYSIRRAADATETINKFEAVFKDQTRAAEAFATSLAKSTGRSELQIQSMMATLQDTFVPLGFARDKARELSQQMVELGIDVASFQNKLAPDVVHNFTSAIVGNHEAVRGYGVMITEATLNQELLNMGIKGGTKEATEQEKVLARLRIILNSTKDAQGDAARTAQSLANRWKAMRAAIGEVSVAIGSLFVPEMKKATEVVTKLMEKLTELSKTTPGVVKAIISIGAAITGLVASLPILVKIVTHFRKSIGLLKAGLKFLVAHALGLKAVVALVFFQIGRYIRARLEQNAVDEMVQQAKQREIITTRFANRVQEERNRILKEHQKLVYETGLSLVKQGKSLREAIKYMKGMEKDPRATDLAIVQLIKDIDKLIKKKKQLAKPTLIGLEEMWRRMITLPAAPKPEEVSETAKLVAKADELLNSYKEVGSIIKEGFTILDQKFDKVSVRMGLAP